MDIEGSGALVVGGASGLGEATARRLHAQGAAVTIADVNAEKGQALADELGAAFAACDVREEDQVEAAVQAAAGADAGLRICVNCAGTGFAQKIAGSRGPHALEPFAVIIAINLIGTFNVLRLAATAMRENEPDDGAERGVCVQTASVAAFDGQIGQIAYSASKGGIVGMTLPAARDLAQHGIRVNAIAPGIFDTPMVGGLPDAARESLAKAMPFPQRLGLPEEYAQLVVDLAQNGYINAETIRLDAAVRLAPR